MAATPLRPSIQATPGRPAVERLEDHISIGEITRRSTDTTHGQNHEHQDAEDLGIPKDVSMLQKSNNRYHHKARRSRQGVDQCENELECL